MVTDRMALLFGGIFVFGWVLAVVALIVGRISSGRTGYESNERLFGVFDRFDWAQWKAHMPKRLYAAVFYSMNIGAGLVCFVLIAAAVVGLLQVLT